MLQSAAEEEQGGVSADYEAVLAQSLGQQEELIKEKQDAARLSIRARKATKIARAWVARRIRLEPEKDPLAAMYAERLNEYDEQLKSKDVKEGEVCLFCNDMWRRGHVGPLHWSAQTDYTKNYRPFVLDVACPLIARLERTQLKTITSFSLPWKPSTEEISRPSSVMGGGSPALVGRLPGRSRPLSRIIRWIRRTCPA